MLNAPTMAEYHVADPTNPFVSASALAEKSGGFCRNLKGHGMAYLPGGHRRLVVTFDNLSVFRDGPDRLPWGYDFLSAQGWDVLGIMVKRPDWFRHPDVWDQFDQLRDAGFFSDYDHVAMYGSSMGAYGALAFAPAAPGCTVLALAPQTTLDRTIVPFDTRYPRADRLTNWGGRYSDAAEGVKSAGRAYVVFDPRQSMDAAHAARLQGENIVFLRAPGVGHKIPPAFKKMGILKPLCERGLTGDLTLSDFGGMFRARRDSPPWIENLLIRAQARNHPKLALRAAEFAMANRRHWKIRKQLMALRRANKAARAPVPSVSSDTDPI
jgi:hypothetical protein